MSLASGGGLGAGEAVEGLHDLVGVRNAVQGDALADPEELDADYLVGFIQIEDRAVRELSPVMRVAVLEAHLGRIGLRVILTHQHGIILAILAEWIDRDDDRGVGCELHDAHDVTTNHTALVQVAQATFRFDAIKVRENRLDFRNADVLLVHALRGVLPDLVGHATDSARAMARSTAYSGVAARTIGSPPSGCASGQVPRPTTGLPKFSA